MDRVKAIEFLGLNKSGQIKLNKGLTVSFVRMDESDIDRIETMSDSKLEKEWRRVSVLISGGNLSVSDIQELTLLEMELESRCMNKQDLKGGRECL